MACGATPVEAHHVEGLALGGTHEGPGVPLCLPCHREVTKAERLDRVR